jgi:hypothetical protein
MKAKYLLDLAEDLAKTARKAIAGGSREEAMREEAQNLARRMRMQMPLLVSATPVQRQKIILAGRLAKEIGKGWNKEAIQSRIEAYNKIL